MYNQMQVSLSDYEADVLIFKFHIKSKANFVTYSTNGTKTK